MGFVYWQEGNKTGYAYTDDLAPEKILEVARIAARIAAGPARLAKVGLATRAPVHDFYQVALPRRTANYRRNWP